MEAERWTAVVDRWQRRDALPRHATYAGAYAAILRALMWRDGIEQALADADEAVRSCAAQSIVTPAPALYQGLARVLSGDLEMAHSKWSRAEALAEQASTVLRRAGIDESYATPLVCAAQARTALHRGDAAAARDALVRAQRLRPLLTYAMPQLAVQARIELTRVHLALADIAGARTLMQELDELLRRRPGLGILADEAQGLRLRLSEQRGASTPGASSLTAAELRLLPPLTTHVSFPEIAEELVLSHHTVKSQAYSLYRKLGPPRAARPSPGHGS